MSGGIPDDLPLASVPEEAYSVFETMRSYGGFVPGIRDHWMRLGESAKTLRIDFPLTFEDFKRRVTERLGSFLIRPTVFKDRIRFIFLPPPALDPKLYEEGVSLATAAERLALLEAAPVGTKSIWYGPQALTHLGRLGTHFEVLFLDTEGYAGELRINNFFIVKGGVLKTPPAVHILDGVTRRLVIELARASGLPVEENFLTRHEIFNASECFLTNSVVEVMPVSSLDGRTIAGGRPGPVTRRLHDRYRQMTREVSV